MRFKLIITSLILFVISQAGIANQMTDPLLILQKHYEATGGLEKHKQEKTTLMEAKLYLAGLEGTVKQWNEVPGKSRQELDLQILTQVEGDDGNTSWIVDSNGKLKINRDKATLEKREISKAMEQLEFMDPNSEIFTLKFGGIEPVGETDCYKIIISNSINKNVKAQFFSTKDFYKLKSCDFENKYETQTLYSDFREVNGLIKPFLYNITEVNTGQEQKIEVMSWESNIEIDQSLFQVPNQDIKDFEFIKGNSSENIPFKYIYNHVFLYVTIDNDVQLWVLDNGADVTCINRQYAERMGWEISGNLKGEGVNNTVEFGFLEIPEYSIKGIRLKSQTVATLDFTFIEKGLGIELAGILGYDFLSRFVTKIDYANETLSFYDPDTFEYKGNGSQIDAPLTGKMFSFPATVDGKYTGAWGADIGSGSLSFHYPFASENNLLGKDGVLYMGGGAGGEMQEKRSKFNTLSFAGFTIDNPYIDLPADSSTGSYANDRLIGEMGNPLFCNFIFYMDYKNQRLIFEKGNNFNKPKPVDKSGIQLYYNDNEQLYIHYLSPGCPGEKAGFKKGDIFLSINDIGIESFNGLEAIQKLFKKQNNTQYKIKIQRGDKDKTLKLTLKDLY